MLKLGVVLTVGAVLAFLASVKWFKNPRGRVDSLINHAYLASGIIGVPMLVVCFVQVVIRAQLKRR
ncbi:MAG: hypothetical protein A3A51_04495 [Candidatus Levybacteria bacterium RIFCSPLOWO2_01_FULL_39_10]|nr:MAG: hypothetical protein A3A51_04495 [Candidatus Levybacteria bacterium RIFCSPLOWO2_01_FULL_39_10]